MKILKIFIRLKKITLGYFYYRIQKFKINDYVFGNFVDIVSFNLFPKYTKKEKDIICKIENLRTITYNNYKNKNVETFASPKTGEYSLDKDGNIKPGNLNISTGGGFSKTGTKGYGGVELLKLAESISADTILELGSNTGLSGCYLLNSKYKPHLTTIEGSGELAKIASNNLSKFSDSFNVINSLFDDALKILIKNNKKFDLIFIDGQHEEESTLYYEKICFELLSPSGILVFDDIYWSKGMNKAWDKIKSDSKYSFYYALYNRGFVFKSNNISDLSSMNFDISKYLGKPTMNRKNW